MEKILFLAFLALIFSNSSHALDACDPLNPVAKISEKIESDAKGSASTLFKIGAIDGDVKISLEKETINIYEKHEDANKTVIKGKLIYLYCRVILNSKSLSDLQKLNAIRKLYSENDELNIPENTSNLIQYKEIEFRLKSCNQKSNTIKCKFSIKNTSKDKNIYLSSNSFLIDSDGDKYTVSNIKFGKITGKSHPNKLLVKNISVKAEMMFNSVTSNGTEIPLIKFGVGNHDIEFRSIPLIN